ncbi:unnamed protein product, partial [Rotaria sordida]
MFRVLALMALLDYRPTTVVVQASTN